MILSHNHLSIPAKLTVCCGLLSISLAKHDKTCSIFCSKILVTALYFARLEKVDYKLSKIFFKNCQNTSKLSKDVNHRREKCDRLLREARKLPSQEFLIIGYFHFQNAKKIFQRSI